MRALAMLGEALTVVLPTAYALWWTAVHGTEAARRRTRLRAHTARRPAR